MKKNYGNISQEKATAYKGAYKRENFSCSGYYTACNEKHGNGSRE